MSVEVAENIITPELVLDVYKRLIFFDLSDEIGFHSEVFVEGQIDGFLQCFMLLLGDEVDSENYEQAYNEGKTLTQVSDDMYRYVLSQIDVSRLSDEDDIEHWKRVRAEAEPHIQGYIRANYSSCLEAVKRA